MLDLIKSREISSFDFSKIDFCFIAKKVFSKSIDSKEYDLWDLQRSIVAYIKTKGVSPIFLKNFDELFITLSVGRFGVKYNRAIASVINSLLSEDDEDLFIVTDNIVGFKSKTYLPLAIRNNPNRNAFIMNLYTGQMIIRRTKDGDKTKND